jgi:excisionase family DNA binding protein
MDFGPLLTVPQAAERFNTSERFVRRLIEERRIRFVKLGRHIRIPVSEVDDFISAGVVEPVRLRLTSRNGKVA